MERTAQRGRKRKRKTRVSRKEAAAEIESDGRRNEIADELTVSAFKLGPFLIYTINLHDVPPGRPCACAGENIL